MKYLVRMIIVGMAFGLFSCNGTVSEEQNKVQNKTQTEVGSLIPVRVELMEAQTFNHYVELTAYLEAESYAYISPEMAGQIKAIPVKEGDFVKKGRVLAELNTAMVSSQIEQVTTQLELARKTYEKQEALWKQKIGSEIQYLQSKTQKESLESQLKSLQSQRDMSIIKAPFDGTVDKINFKIGELASPGIRMIELVNLDKMKVKAEASERLLPVIKKGEEVQLGFPTYPDKKMTAPVYRTSNVINPANRTFGVEVRLGNKDHLLKPNMLANLKVNDLHIPNSIIVPSIIVKNDFDKEFIYLAINKEGQWFAQKTYITTGASYQEKTLVQSGLSVGDHVIVEGYNTVSNGVKLNILK